MANNRNQNVLPRFDDFTFMVMGEPGSEDFLNPFTLASTGNYIITSTSDVSFSSLEGIIEIRRTKYSNRKIPKFPRRNGHFPVYKVKESKLKKRVLICNCGFPNCTLVPMVCLKCFKETAVWENMCEPCIAKFRDAQYRQE